MSEEIESNTNSCGCGSNITYALCCRDFHDGSRQPSTAEQLMRSRYTAYQLELIDYLVSTTHPKTLLPTYRQQLVETKGDTIWTGLSIVRSSMGAVHDKIGKVHFIATYIMNGKQGKMEEHSRFRRYNGRWLYYDENG